MVKRQILEARHDIFASVLTLLLVCFVKVGVREVKMAFLLKRDLLILIEITFLTRFCFFYKSFLKYL